ncbi:F-box protein At1g80960-like isoform X2 [Rutidosis leptorrhynchoides]|uniref:F-box protein At1g80960-like isoform X2 n=1 Tax=Rutidosis leptorrhynchoides TaxID=125765 RepID=UPI003A9953C4
MDAQRLLLDGSINNLPYDILENILFRLPTEEVVRASVLSKQWRYNWTKIPKVVFTEDLFDESPNENQLPVIEQGFVNPQSERKKDEQDVINHLPSFNGYGNLTTLCLEYVRIDRKTLKQFLSNNPQLKSFTMVSHNSTWIFTEDEYETMNALFQCLPVIENLTLCVSEIQHLRRGMVPRELATSLVHLKYLCLERMCFLENDWLRFLVLMTRSSPDLEKLRLQMHCEDAGHWNYFE